MICAKMEAGAGRNVEQQEGSELIKALNLDGLCLLLLFSFAFDRLFRILDLVPAGRGLTVSECEVMSVSWLGAGAIYYGVKRFHQRRQVLPLAPTKPHV